MSQRPSWPLAALFLLDVSPGYDFVVAPCQRPRWLAVPSTGSLGLDTHAPALDPDRGAADRRGTGVEIVDRARHADRPAAGLVGHQRRRRARRDAVVRQQY